MKRLLMVVGAVLAVVAGALVVGCEPMDGTGNGEKTTRERLIGVWVADDVETWGTLTLNRDGTLHLRIEAVPGQVVEGKGSWSVSADDVLTSEVTSFFGTVVRMQAILILTATRLCVSDAGEPLCYTRE